jgi:hypothetical protein
MRDGALVLKACGLVLRFVLGVALRLLMLAFICVAWVVMRARRGK